MCKKVLFVATVVKMHINVFHLPYLRMLKELGYQTYVAARNDLGDSQVSIPNCDIYVDVPFGRSPLDVSNIKAYYQLKKIIESNEFDIIHCHTPMGGIICRLAARNARKRGTKVVYTAHGFHFYKGSPVKNWLLFYPAEKLCSYLTDVLVTINKEDYELAHNKMKAKRIAYIPGVGIDVGRFRNCIVDREAKRVEMAVPKGAFLFLSVGEINKNKNHSSIIRAVAKLRRSDVHYAIAGRGPLEAHLRSLAQELGVAEQIHLLGFRYDVAELYKVADAYIHPSFREGLPVSVMEAMASGLPCIVSDIRGSADLIQNRVSGYIVDSRKGEEFADAMELLMSADIASVKDMGAYNSKFASCFDLSVIVSQMKEVYS